MTRWFIREFREYGWRVAVGNLAIVWVQLFIGAKRIRITYRKRSNKR